MEHDFEQPAGAPTFEEFKRNPEKYLGRNDEVLASADHGPSHLRKITNKVLYEIEGHRCKTVEEVERIAMDYGIPLKEMKYTGEVIPLGGGKCDILVKFISNTERARRETR